MLKKHQQTFALLFILSDIFIITISWILAYLLRFKVDIVPVTKGIPHFRTYLELLIFIILIWISVFRWAKLYTPRRGRSIIDEFFSIFKASNIAIIILIALTFFYRQYSYSRMVIVYFWVISIFLLGLSRGVLRSFFRFLRRKGYNLRRILIAGAGDLGQMVADKIEEFPGMGFKVVGFVDENLRQKDFKNKKFKIIGNLDQIVKIIHQESVDQLFIAFPLSAYNSLEKVFKLIEKEIIDVKIVPDLLQFITLKAGLEDLDGLPIINLGQTPLSGWYEPVKRLADLFFSLLSIIILSPFLLIIALAIKLTSPGPVFYKQKRMGLGGEVFQMYKFRSMKVDAEKETGAVWAKEDDPRRTKLGRWLRKTSLDELPQLFNVFKGEMSFVGPRPERPFFVEQFKEKIPHYMLRHKVKAGITGWAQVNGWRGNTSIPKRIEYDIYYIENWSMSFDVKIMWLTIWKGLIHKHAY